MCYSRRVTQSAVCYAVRVLRYALQCYAVRVSCYNVVTCVLVAVLCVCYTVGEDDRNH